LCGFGRVFPVISEARFGVASQARLKPAPFLEKGYKFFCV
jgi:hypothetical protein